MMLSGAHDDAAVPADRRLHQAEPSGSAPLCPHWAPAVIVRARAPSLLVLAAAVGCADPAGRSDAGTGGQGQGGRGGESGDTRDGGGEAPRPCNADCGSGACQPTIVATGLTAPVGLAIDDAWVYFTDTNADNVMRVAKAGGAPVAIVPHQFAASEQPYGIAVTSTQIFWTAYFAAFIGRAGLAGESPLLLSTGQGYATRIAVDDTSVYWIIPGGIRKIGRDGGTAVAIGAQSGARDLVVDPTGVYLTSSGLSSGGGLVVRMGLGGEAPVTLASGLNDPQGIALDPTHVYWTEKGGGTVMKVPRGGGAATVLASGQQAPLGLAVVPAGVYWTNSTGGTVMNVGLDGGSPVTLVSGQQRPTQIAVDACDVYWLDEAAGTVSRVPR
jgi:hypothetical protein